MRTIMGFCGSCTDITMFTKGLMQAAPFGPADSRIVDLGCGLLGYHRRAAATASCCCRCTASTA